MRITYVFFNSFIVFVRITHLTFLKFIPEEKITKTGYFSGEKQTLIPYYHFEAIFEDNCTKYSLPFRL